MGYIAIWALFHRDQVPASDMSMTFMQKIYESRHPIPAVILIGLVLGSTAALLRPPRQPLWAWPVHWGWLRGKDR